MTGLLEITSVRCRACGSQHPATLARRGDQMIGTVDCPLGKRSVLLSSNAAVFQTLRSRAHSPAGNGAARPRLLNLLPVTQHCNLRCPICYANAGPETAPKFLPVADAVARMRLAKQRGARTVSLTGGEATLHPELPGIIREARRLRLRVFLVTNGVRLAQEPALAVELKRAGLSRVSLQFDTLNPATLHQLRGADDVAAKQQAARNVIAAGLRLGLIATVTRHNLDELDALIGYGLSLGPALATITLQAAAPAGRFEVGADAVVDKEQILGAVLSASSLPGVSLDDVWPLPQFAPWGMALHPDCGVNLILLTNSHRLEWLRESVNLPELHRRLASATAQRNWAARNLLPLRHLFAAARPGRRALLLAHVAGFVAGRGRRGMLIIGVGEFCRPGFLDEARLAGCCTDELTEHGGISPCVRYTEAQ